MSTPDSGSARTHIFVAVGAFLVMVANAIPLSVLSIFTPFVTRDLGFDTGSFQVYYSLLAAATALAMPLSGRLIAPWGARRLLLLGGVISALGLVGLAFSGALWHFYVSGTVLGFGVGLGCMFVPVVLVNTWFVARRGMVMGIVLAGTGVGGAIMSLFIPLIIGEGEGWRTGFVTLAAVMASFTILPTLLLIRNRPSDIGLLPHGGLPPQQDTPTSEPGMTFAQALRSPWFYLFYLTIVLLGIVIAVVQSLSVHLDLIGLAAWIGPLMMIITLGLVFWKVVLGVLIDALGLRWAMIITLGLCAGAFFILPGTTTVWVLVLCMIAIAAGTANGTVVPPLAGSVAFGARDYPAIWGVGATAFSVGTAVGTPLWGWVKDLTGDYNLVFRMLPFLIAVTVVGLLLAMHRGHASYTGQV
ncbi:MAG: MFS transporter [Corynebacterium sp.]|uniref:MFS transporter n=1 Tax=Corynebacterium sp. TaxID=1720 RepID=UPI0026DF897F|nr:MFS transporter [Corynebacterium sp.]MDO5670264.1 MFS transporter [Corynebacterium sp.]